MSLFQKGVFEEFVSALAGTSFVDQWESRVAKVGDKVFTLWNEDGGTPRITLKCPEESFEILTALEGVGQAPYFAKRKWVSISQGAPLSDKELCHYIEGSYMLVAGGLTKKLRAELGIAL